MNPNLKVQLLLSADAAVLSRELRAAREGLHDISTAAQSAASASSSALLQLEQHANSAGKGIAAMADSWGFLASAGGFGAAAIQMADQYAAMSDRIRMATSSTAEYEMVQQRLLAVANATYRPLAEAQEAFLRTADALRATGASTSDALDMSESFSLLLVANAASAEKGANALDAWSQAVQKGRVEADNWMSIVAAVPTVIDHIARSSGRSAAEVRKLGVEGRLSVRELNAALQESLEANRAAAEGMHTTVADGFTHLRNQLTVAVGEMNQATGATAAMAQALKVLGDASGGIVVAGMMAVGAAAAAAAAKLGLKTAALVQSALASRAAAAAELQAAQAHAASTAAAAQAAARFAGLSISHAQAAAAANAHTAALTRLAAAQRAASTVGAVSAALGGPVGLVAVAGAAAAALWALSQSAQTAGSAFADLNTPLSAAREQFAQLGRAGQLAELSRLEADIQSAQQSAHALIDTLRGTARRERFGGPGEIAAHGEAAAALEAVLKTAADVASGAAVDFDAAASAIAGASNMGEDLRRKLLDLIGQISQAQTRTDGLRQRYDELKAATQGAAAAQRELNAAQADTPEAAAIVAKMARALEDKKDNTHAGRLQRDIRDLDEYRRASAAQQQEMLRIAREMDALDAAARAPRLRAPRIDDGKQRAEQLARSQHQFVEQLERQAATIGMSAAQLREYELAGQNLTGDLAERARAALDATAAHEREAAALQAASQAQKAAASVSAELLEATGRSAAAQTQAALERFAQLREQLAAAGHSTGLAQLEQLQSITQQRQHMQQLQQSADAALSAQALAEQTLAAATAAGLVDEASARTRLLAVHQATAQQIQQILPAMRELAAASADPTMGQGVQQLELRLLQIAASAQQLGEQMRTDFERAGDALSQTFGTALDRAAASIATGAAGIGEVMQRLVLDVIQGMGQWAGGELANALQGSLKQSLGQLMGAGSGEGSPLGGLFAGLGGFLGLGNAHAAGAGQNAAGGLLNASGAAVQAASASADAAASAAAAAAQASATAAASALAAGLTSASAAAGALGAAATSASAAQTAATTAATGLAAALQAAAAAAASGAAAGQSSGLVRSAAGILGFADGGFTGAGGKYQAAGIVHAGEFVARREVVAQPGARAFLEQFNRIGMRAVSGLRGYADGGFVSTGGTIQGLPSAAAAPSADTTVDNRIAINLIDDPERIAGVLRSPQGEKALTVMLSRNPAKFRQLLQL